jgi:hypothetical protein
MTGALYSCRTHVILKERGGRNRPRKKEFSMEGTWSDGGENSFTFNNDKIILKGSYWDTIGVGVKPDGYQYQAVWPKIIVDVNKRKGNSLELIEVFGENEQYLVNNEIPKAFHLN